MTLADFTSSGLVIPRLHGREVASIIQELSQALQREGRVSDWLPFFHAALNREFLVGTNMEMGMAFPHARMAGLKQLSFAFGRSDEPLAWSKRGAHSVRLVFLSAVPPSDSTQYLSLISGLARLAKDPRLLDRIHSAADTFQILEVFDEVKLRVNVPSTLSNKDAPL
jgi:mannitol/fructose-specific phosphotransferase system IIA component (Ntr-type)